MSYFCTAESFSTVSVSLLKISLQTLPMKIYHGTEHFIRPDFPVVTIGTFDGVHLGHRMILDRLVELARDRQGEIVLMTFYPHPRKVVQGPGSPPEMLTSMDEKIDLLREAGVQHLVIQSFTTEFSRMEYDVFVRDMLVNRLGVKTLVVGYDHQFGYQRKGGMKALAALAPELGFEVVEIPEKDIDAIAVSSTRIRKALAKGEVEVAAQLLGYDYRLTGKVIHGNKIGRTLGFRTANLSANDQEKLVPANGVYAVKVLLRGEEFNGALSIGNRPVFDNGHRSIEVHILGFDQDIYGEEITLVFKHFLRPEMRFPSVEDLVVQMGKDVEHCLLLLNSDGED